jgi:hypothetical protein
VTDESTPQRLFYEPGGSWLWLLLGPFAGIGMGLLQMTGGYGHDLWIPMVFLLLVSGFVAVQIKAARIHTSVELTTDILRQGTETVELNDVVKIYPEASGAEQSNWQSARALGELTGVPRGRTGIGLKLDGGRTVQAWARKHRQLREHLALLIEERTP